MNGSVKEHPGDIGLSIVMPAYNASAFIHGTTREVSKALQDIGVPWEVIVVDDGSSDGTAEAVFSHTQVRAIRLPLNMGKGAAIKAGMLLARGYVRIFTDADLPYGTVPFKHAFEYIESRGFHAVIGDRVLPGSQYGHSSSLRTMISRIASLVFRTLVTGGMYDTQCGFKAFRGDVATALFELVTIQRFAVDVEIIYLLLKYHLDIKRIQVRQQNESPSTVHVVRDTMRAISDVFRIRWKWMRGRYDSPALAKIFLEDSPQY